MIDDKTPHLKLPLPHADNLLDEDVLRLREALSALDVKAEAVDAALENKADADAVAIALDLKADASTMATELAKKSNAATVTAALATKADTAAMNTALALKADVSALASKADVSALASKADVSTLASKADVSALALKADVSALAQKANLATTVSASIGTAWSGAAPPYTQTVSVAGVTASSIVEVTLPASATQAHIEAFRALNWTDGGQAAGKITLKAWGTKNTAAIPVTVIVRG